MEAPPADETGRVVVRRMRRSEPRPAETELLRRLLAGPRPLCDGPVGRCTKRGWLRVVADDARSRNARGPAVRYELTEAGRAAVGV